METILQESDRTGKIYALWITLSPASGGLFNLILSHQRRGNWSFPPSMVRQAHHKREGIKGRVKQS
jgi:hypothetical protein